MRENIARMETDHDPDAVVAAAKRAGVHEMILGYQRETVHRQFESDHFEPGDQLISLVEPDEVRFA